MDKVIHALQIEDSKIDAMLLADALHRSPLATFELDHVERLHLGQEKLKEKSYDIVLLDLDLPDSKGLETFQQIKTTYPGLPIVVFSGNADENVAIQAVQNGAQDYIVKGQASWDWAVRSIFYAIERAQAQAALRISEERFRQAMDSINEVFYITDAIKGKILYISPAYELVWGRTTRSLYADRNSFVMAIEEAYRPMVFATLEKQMRGEATSMEYRITRPDGSKRWIRDRSFPGFDGAGNVIHITGIAEDVTEQKIAEEKIRESESRYRLLAENMSETVWLMDTNFKYLYASPSVAQQRGFSIDELNEIPLEKQMTPASHLRMQAFIAEAFLPENLQGPNPHLKYTLELEFYRKDGSAAWSENNFTIICDSDGKPFQIAGSGRDISERKMAELAMQESQARFRTFVEESRDGFVIINKNGMIVTWNKAQEKITGIPQQKAINSPYWEIQYQLMTPASRKRVSLEILRNRLQNALGDKTDAYLNRVSEVEIVSAAGEFKSILTSSFPIETGQNYFIGSVVYDITERKETETALRNAERKYHIVADNTADWEFWLSPEKEFIYVSPSCEKITGYTRDEFQKDSSLLEKIVHPEDLDGYMYHRQTVDETMFAGRHEFRIRRTDGSYRWIEHACQPIFDENGKFLGTRGNNRDVTERKQADLALKFSEENYRSLAENSEGAIAVLDRDGRVRYANIQGIKLWDDPQVVGKTIYDIFPIEYAARYAIAIQKVIDTQTNLVDEAETMVNGKQMWFRLSMNPFKNADGSVNTLIMNAWDITRRKQEERYTEVRLRLANLSQQEISMENLLRTTIDQAELLTNSNIGFFHFVDDDQTNISLQTWSTNTLETMCQAEGKGQHYPIANAGVWADSVRYGQSQVYNDYENLPGRMGVPAGHVKITRMISVPIKRNNLVVAVLGIGNKPQQYDSRDLEMVERLADETFDIVMRKRTEETLRLREEQYRTLFETMLHGVVYQDVNGHILSANPAAERILGLTLDQMKGRTSTDSRWHAIHENGTNFKGDEHPAMRALRSGQHAHDLMGIFNPANSSYCWIDVNAIPQFRPGEQTPYQVYTTFEDITERKEAQEQSQVQIAALQAAANAIMITNTDGIIEWVNAAWTELTGYSPAEAIGKSTSIVSSGKQDRLFYNQLWDTILSGRTWKNELINKRKDGSLYYEEETIAPVLNEQDKVTHFIGVKQDITERKNAEKERQELIEALRERTEDMSLLLEAGRALSETLNPQEIYRLIYYYITAALPCDNLRISLFDEQSQLISCVYLQNESGIQDVANIPQRPLGAPEADTQSQVICSGESLLLPDYVEEPDENGICALSAIIVPLKAGGKVAGLLQIFSSHPNAHTEDHLRFVESLAFRVSAALSNAQLVAELENRVRERTAEIETIRRRLELATKAAELGIWDWNMKTGQIIWDDQMYTIYGVKAGAFNGNLESFTSFVHPEDAATLADFVQLTTSGAPHSQIQYRVLRDDGSTGYVQAHGAILYDAAGKPEHIIGVVQDITQSKLAEQTLRESEERYRKAIIAADAVPYTLDYASNAYTFIGDGIEKITGYNQAEMSPRLFDSIIEQTSMHGDLGWLTTHEATHKVRSGDPNALHAIWRSDFRIRQKNGGIRWLSDISVQVLDVRNKPVGSIGILQDITERKKAEQALRESEETYRALFENANDAIFLINPDGELARVNSRCEELLGYSAEEMMGHRAFDYLVRNEVSDAGNRMERLLAGEYIPAYERKFRRKDGVEIETEINLSLIRDENRLPKLVQSMVRDITQRKRAEQALRQSEEQNRLLFEESPDAVTLLDDAGHIIRANRAYEELTHMPRKEVIGLTIQKLGLMGEESIARLEKAITQAKIKPENISPVEYVLNFNDGRQRSIESRIFPLVIDGNTHILTTSRDITAHKQAEETLRLANAEMERALRLKDEFLANMSHELRTPLNAILGISESLGEQISGPLNDKQLRYIRVIHESGQHLLNLINDILDLSKIEAGKITLDINKVHLKSVCETSMRMVKELALKKRQEVRFQYDDKVDLIMGDERRLKQMLVNLLSNAVKFTPEGGQFGIEVHGDTHSEQVFITVWDKGIGIKAIDLPRLFQPFTQLDAGLTREQSGTGLGLALVSQMARLHGGSVAVKSEQGKGSRFTISLPWIGTHPSVAPTPHQEIKTPVPQLPAPEQSRPIILLVEDTETVAMVVGDYLESAGYQVVQAKDGLEALAITKRLLPDLIMMDVQMPVMDGLEATQRIRSDARLARIPIVALTALAMQSDRERCLAAGMNEYLSKPVHLKELLQVIQRLLNPEGDPA